jgi:hypothetical protein
MYSTNKQTFISIPKHNKDIESNINKKNDKHDYETIRNIVLEKNDKNIENNNNKTKNHKFDIV